MEQKQISKLSLATVKMILETRPTELRKEPIWKRVGLGYESGFRITRNNKIELVMITQYDSQDKADFSYVEISGKRYACDSDIRYIIFDKLQSIKEKESESTMQYGGITR